MKHKNTFILLSILGKQKPCPSVLFFWFKCMGHTQCHYSSRHKSWRIIAILHSARGSHEKSNQSTVIKNGEPLRNLKNCQHVLPSYGLLMMVTFFRPLSTSFISNLKTNVLFRWSHFHASSNRWNGPVNEVINKQIWHNLTFYGVA